ncbi:cation transporting ATPase C-terminal domain-containing protein [Clostridium sp.]|jgi:Ca2+-transporting ATPase|uniref:cation transporting ATPase C-terminal domain-containing protein n=1 Tax=Clostridium sp. TaxID=1506 RepID=UPI003EEF5DBC
MNMYLFNINLVTDSLPAIAIGLEPHNKNIMNEKPRNINSPILNKSFSIEVLIEGLLIALGTITAFHIGLSTGNDLVASTMAFATLCLSRLLHGFNSRPQESIFRIGVFSNRYLWIAIILGYLLLEFVLSFKPLMGVFEVAPLTLKERAIVYVFLYPILILSN